MANFQTKLKKQFEAQGFLVLKIIRLSENAYPDLILLKDGNTSFIEVKEPTDTLKPLQKVRIDQLIKQGFQACCIQKGKGIIYGKLDFYNG